MALKPVLKLKVDELFLRWLSEAETQTLLKANLRQILRGEPLQQPNYAIWPPKSETTRPQKRRRPPRRPLALRSPQTRHPSRSSAKKKRTTPPSAQNIPEFYFPSGRPNSQGNESLYLTRIREEFTKAEGGKLEKEQMEALCKACGFPHCMKGTLFTFVGGDRNGHVTLQAFLAVWRKMRLTCFDEASQFVRILAKPNCNYLEEDDMKPLVQDVVDTHPGLSFLHEAKEFHSRYVQTVISRIFYCVNRSWSGRITAAELRKSNLLQTLHLLDEEEDINQVMDFFSYEHFYVIYCKFWELDKDHDLSISREDLMRHADHAISTKMIDRIFSGAVTKNLPDGKMSYRDFVWFLISEEDKRHPTSIEYWFRCMDLDGDGIISLYEMEYFYEEQVQKMESLGIETLPFEDCVCQMIDMVRPREKGRITLMDLKACQMTPVFFDTFFNLDKYLEHEQRDPFANIRDIDGDEPEMSDWEKFAAEEYEILVAEEGASDAHNEEMRNVRG
ncbi:hypothetical protein CAPTEDRAFT_225045 [Capitella teleta]|uniref:EF-hand domain-containing protein n=1 Tax=Capitella teleta TaxID=283909 RepID=R7U4F0_CAPTE|nr:hypothetical protein CAPTEDRAFT_225045 [Capitella teleta]|eukprot:ELU01240.1 hypothetical protein CAPTEDRAFT_225045 [Capitella teleta]